MNQKLDRGAADTEHSCPPGKQRVCRRWRELPSRLCRAWCALPSVVCSRSTELMGMLRVRFVLRLVKNDANEPRDTTQAAAVQGFAMGQDMAVR